MIFINCLLVIFEPTLSCCLNINLSNTIYFLKRILFLHVLSEYHMMFTILQWNDILRDILFYANRIVIFRNSRCTGYKGINKIQLHPIKFGLKIILIYLQSNTYIPFTFNIFFSEYNEAKGTPFFENECFCIYSNFWFVN